MICVGLAKSSLFGLAPSYAPSGLFPSNLLRPALCGSLYCRTTELSDSARALHKKIINIMVTALMAILPKARWLNSSQQHRALKIWNDYTTNGMQLCGALMSTTIRRPVATVIALLICIGWLTGEHICIYSSEQTYFGGKKLARSCFVSQSLKWHITDSLIFIIITIIQFWRNS